MSRTYTLPGSDIEVICEYDIKRNQDVVLGDCYIGDQEIDPTVLFIKVTGVSDENFYMRDLKVISLAQYFQSKLDHAANDILNDEYFGREAAE